MLQSCALDDGHSKEAAQAAPSRKAWPTKQAELAATITPLAYGFDEAVVAARTNRKRLRRALNSGELPAVKDGRKLIILASDLIAWRRNLPAYVGGVSPTHTKQAATSVAA